MQTRKMTEKQQTVLDLLRNRGSRGATTKEIEDLCVVAAARDWVRRLRDGGIPVKTVEEKRSPAGCRVVRYVLNDGEPAQRDFWGIPTRDAR